MQSNECEGDEVTRDQAVATWGEPSVAGVDERAEEHVAEWWPTPYEEDCAREVHMTIVLLSGGQDSTTCLYWALRAVRGTAHHIAEDPPPRVRALFVEYGQRHMRERASAIAIARDAHVPLHMGRMVLPFFSGLTQDSPIETMPDGLPSTFVPGRNAQFLAMAAGLAKRHGSDRVVIGCSAVDFSGYPDCRPDFIVKQQAALESGLAIPGFKIAAPLIDRTKAQTVRLARELGAEAWEAIGKTWTCYIGGERPCGECPACVLRARGFDEAGEEDPACPR